MEQVFCRLNINQRVIIPSCGILCESSDAKEDVWNIKRRQTETQIQVHALSHTYKYTHTHIKKNTFEQKFEKILSAKVSTSC